MKSKSLFSIYVMLGIMGAITTQALPVVYSSYGLDSNQIYNLISIVFLATAFQPILGFIIDKFFTQERGISLLLFLVAVVGVGLVFVTTYPFILFVILLFSVFRIPLFAIMDGYSAGIAQKHGLNMGLIRSGSTVGFGVGLTSLLIFLNVFNLSANYSFLYMAILALVAVIIIEINNYKTKNRNIEIEEKATTTLDQDEEHNTQWVVVSLLLILQVCFFGFSILKVNYTTPYLVEYGYSNQIIATTTLIGTIPIFILMPLFGKIFNKFKHTTIIALGISLNVVQTALLLLFPTSVVIVYLATFLNGFIFPLYTPVFGLLLRKALSPKYVSTGFTTLFMIQNLSVFCFNQFVLISLLNTTGTTATAYITCLVFFIFSFIPLIILRINKF